MNLLFQNNLIYLATTSSGLVPSISDLTLNPANNTEHYENAMDLKEIPEDIKSVQTDLQRRVQALEIPALRKMELMPVIRNASDRKALNDLEKMIEKAKKYQDISKSSGLFTRESIMQAMGFVAAKENLPNIDKNFDTLVTKMIPEENRRLKEGLKWYSFDKDITLKYHERAQVELMIDKRQILCEEVEKNLKAKYDKMLDETIDISSDQGKKQKLGLMQKFEANFDSKNKDFNARSKALNKAKDFLIDLRDKKSPQYKMWYNKQKAQWGKRDSGRLWAIFESIERKDFWNVSETEKMLEQAKAKYEKELKGRYQQALDRAFPNKDTQKSWLESFDKATLEGKITIYEGLVKDNAKFGSTEKKWMAKLYKVQISSPLIFEEFNDRYEKEKMQKPREQILDEVQKEYADLVDRYEKFLDKFSFKGKERDEMMDKFLDSESFDDMNKKITQSQGLVLKEALEKKEAGGERLAGSAKQDKDKKDEVELPEGLEQELLHEVTNQLHHNHDIKKFTLYEMAAVKTRKSQEYHNSTNYDMNVVKDSKEMIDARIGGSQNQLRDAENEEQKKQALQDFQATDCKEFCVEDVDDHWESFMSEDQDIREMANFVGGEERFDFDKKGEIFGSNKYRFVTKQGPLDLRESDNWEMVIGKRKRKQNEEMALSVLAKMGLKNIDDAIFEKTVEMVNNTRDGYIDQNRMDWLKFVGNEDMMTEARKAT